MNYFTIITEMFILEAVLLELKLIVQKPPWESETQHISLNKNMRPFFPSSKSSLKNTNKSKKR